MSFTINESKVEELLKASKKGYEISTSAVEPGSENYAPPSYTASGTSYVAPILVTEAARENLMALRRQIEASGTALKGADELDREIEEMRGRKTL